MSIAMILKEKLSSAERFGDRCGYYPERSSSSRAISTIGTLLVIPILLSSCVSAFADELRCKRLLLQESPQWTNSAIFSLDGSELLVVDPFARAVMIYGLDGTLIRKVTGFAGSADNFRPSLIQAYKNGYLLEEEDGILVFLDNELREESRANLLNVTNEEGDQIGGIYSWTPVGDELLAYGDIHNDSTWRSGLLRISLMNPENFQMLRSVNDRAGHSLFLMGFQFLGTLGQDDGIFLSMEESPGFYEYSHGELIALPPGLTKSIGSTSQRANLPPKRGAANTAELYRAVESSEMSTGIYGTEEKFLYLLNRKPSDNGGGTSWSVVKIDLDDADFFEPGVPIPTIATHLLAVPGRAYWAFFEKGHVEALGKQRIDSVLLVPTNWIEGQADSPLWRLIVQDHACNE